VGSIETIVNVVLVIVLSLYWSFDRVRFERLWMSLLSADVRSRSRDIWRTIEIEVGRYLQSEMVQCIAAGLLLTLGFMAMGQPYPVLMASIGAVAWLIPWVGAPLAMTAVVLMSLPAAHAQNTSLLFMVGPAAAYTLGVFAFLEFVVQPRLFHRQRYNALLVALVVIGLADLLGVLGILLGPPLAAAIQILGEHLLRPANSTTQPAPAPVALKNRLGDLRRMLLQIDQPRPELTNLVDRLEALLDQTQNAPVNAVAAVAGKGRE
jgi:predicted PurR-regulated permease PerM